MRILRAFPIVAASLLAMAGANQASAAMLATPVTTALTQLQEWNLITFNNFTAGNEVEGRVFVGGDYIGSQNEQFNFLGTTSSKGTAALTVVGNASGNKIDVKNGDFVVGGNSTVNTIEGQNQGTVYAGGTVTGSNIHAPVQSGLAGSVTNFTSTLNAQKTSLINTMTSLSSNLKALTSTGSFNTANNAINYTASAGVNVINTSISDLLNYSQNYININSPNGTTTIINVSGTSGNISRNFNSNGSSNNIIWNFYEATNLTLGNWQGAVLAVNADFVKDNAGYLGGTVVAKSANISAELHTYPFQGDLSSVSGIAAPEPSTWMTLILGFGMVGAVLRRREKRSPLLQAV